MTTDATRFIESSIRYLADTWTGTNRIEPASLGVLGSLFGNRQSLIVGDIYGQWARWFIEHIADPRILSDHEISFAQLYPQVSLAVQGGVFSENYSKEERQRVALIITQSLIRTARSIAHPRTRYKSNVEQRELLLDVSGASPRCWICGIRFSKESIEAFRLGTQHKPTLPHFVDLLMPQGLVERDLKIEVDHVVPFSRGGEDEANLRLACGWCNRHKGSNISIYDAIPRPRVVEQNSFGLRTLPRPLWVVRMLACNGRCEYVGGCEATVADGPLFISAVRREGVMNPANLTLTCRDHDPMRSTRLQPAKAVRFIWDSSIAK